MLERANTLAWLSRRLGDPRSNFVLLGEGNTSARLDARSLLVKATGVAMESATVDDFVATDIDVLLRALDEDESEQTWRAALERACAGAPRRPSIEVAVHAVAIGVCGASWVAHTHPTPVNAILCSRRPGLLMAPVFPDQIVVCGAAYVLVPYIDPGRALGIAVRDAVLAYHHDRNEWPRVILLANHGMIALGQTAEDAYNITLMMAKAAEILLGALTAGGIQPLPPDEVTRLATRDDEALRAAMLRRG
jgi:rhamnose utilization protein RhaD (predicted bifunctional aldolase and dehydrogenase)